MSQGSKCLLHFRTKHFHISIEWKEKKINFKRKHVLKWKVRRQNIIKCKQVSNLSIKLKKSLALKIQRKKKKLSFQTFRKYAVKSNIQEEYKISEIFPKNIEFQTPTKIYIYTASFMSQEPKKLIQNNINIFNN